MVWWGTLANLLYYSFENTLSSKASSACTALGALHLQHLDPPGLQVPGELEAP
jgi:hypothetical protein